MDIKQVKKNARINLKRNYFKTILVVFIAGIIIHGGYSYTSYIYDNTKIMHKEYTAIKTDYDAVMNMVYNAFSDGKERRGVLAPLINNITENKSITVGFINTLNNLFFKESLSKTIISISAFVLALILYIFIQNTIRVGQDRYFLEQRRYKTKIDKLLFTYQVKKNIHVAYILFLKSLYQILWSLTIVGGVIKLYEYKMIPYILAVNPDINAKEAFNLSKEMTNGYKMSLFKLDLSLIGWYILQFMTFGISSLFYFNAYKESIYAECYMTIKDKNKLTNEKLIEDKYLDVPTYQNQFYPKEGYKVARRNLFNIDYMADYSLTTYILLFFTFVFGGWIWEVLLGFIETGVFINRGTMHGPWIPLYGYGALLTLIGLKKFRKNPVVFFILAMLVCGIIEYGTAWYLETFKGMRWWYYDGYFMNLHGRVCLEGLLVFGFATGAATYFIDPILNNIFKKIPRTIAIILCSVLLFLFGIDFAYTQFFPNTGYGVTSGISSE